MAGHRCKPDVDLPDLVGTDPVDCGLHVVEDPALRNAAQHPECLGHCVEQHLVSLEGISPYNERLAVRQLGVRRLQLDALAAQNGPVFAPVELEGLARLEDQRHEGAAAAGLLFKLSISFLLRGDHGENRVASRKDVPGW